MPQSLTDAAGPPRSLAAPDAVPGRDGPEPPGAARLGLFDAKAILLAALVLLAGVALGAAGFTVERHYSDYLPRPVRSGTGWIVRDEHGRRFTGLALATDRLAWQDGPLILLMDLRDGRVFDLGPGPDSSRTWQPALTGRFVVWFEGGGGGSGGSVYCYEPATHRRRAVGTVTRPTSYVAASGERAVWTQQDGADQQAQQLVALDLQAGTHTSLTAPPGAGAALIDGDLVVIKQWTGQGDALTALDLTTRRQWSVVAGSGGGMTAFGLSGRRVAWGSIAANGAGRVLVRDVDSGATTLVATAAGLRGPAISGDLVVWARESNGGGAEVMGRRLGGGGTFKIAASGPVDELQVSGGTVAWLTRDAAGKSVIQTVGVSR